MSTNTIVVMMNDVSVLASESGQNDNMMSKSDGAKVEILYAAISHNVAQSIIPTILRAAIQRHAKRNQVRRCKL